MRLSYISGAAILAALIVQIYINDWLPGGTLQLGDVRLNASSIDEVVTLVNPSAAPTVGRYESLDAPRGTSYKVAGIRILRIAYVNVTAAASTSTTVELGYGDTHVEDSVAAPANHVELVSFTVAGGSGLSNVPVLITIPAGKSPYVRLTGGAGSWPGPVSVGGFTERR